MNTLLYAHLPGIAGLESAVKFHSGEINLLPFEIYRKLDVDWANDLLFNSNKPAFWQAAAPVDVCCDLNESLRYASEMAQFYFLALVASTGRVIPDPRLSVCYAIDEKNSRVSNIGPTGRNLILHGNVLPPFGTPQLVRAAELAEGWFEFGLSSRSSVFDCLRACGGSAFVEPHPIVGLLPMVVALEGLLVGRPVQGIVKNMLQAVRTLCGPQVSRQYSESLYKAYDYRSRLVHGRRINDVSDASRTLQELRRLAGTVVIAAVEDAQQARVAPQNMFVHLKGRIAYDG